MRAIQVANDFRDLPNADYSANLCILRGNTVVLDYGIMWR
jgi:hypothetical protein